MDQMTVCNEKGVARSDELQFPSGLSVLKLW